MAHISLLAEARALEGQIGTSLSFYDITELPPRERELATALKHQLIDGRLDIHAYEYAQTRAEQLAAAKSAIHYLTQAQNTIITASEYNLFGAVDVAQLSARIQQLISRLN